MTPFDLLTAIETAYAKPPGRRGVILELRAANVFGIRGRHMGEDERGAIYGFTRRQCRKMEALIYEAARSDMEGSGQ